MSATLQDLMDVLEEAFFIVGSDGVVKLVNKAANMMLPLDVGKKLAIEAFNVQLSSVVNGYVVLPYAFECQSPAYGGGLIRFKIQKSPVGGGYLVSVADVTGETKLSVISANFSNLLSIELADSMRQFSTDLAMLMNDIVPRGEQRRQLSDKAQSVLQQGQMLVTNIVQLATYAETFSKSPILAVDRIMVDELISLLLARLRPLMDQRSINIHFAGASSELPVVYGSRDWLVEALVGYIEYMVKRCGAQHQIEFQIRPFGNFLSFHLHNQGRRVSKNVPSKNFMPFSELGNKQAKAHGESSLNLSLPICKRVIELHHGFLKVKEEENEISMLTIELPVGAPPEDIAPNLGAEQARRFAEDLSRLMQRQRARREQES